MTMLTQMQLDTTLILTAWTDNINIRRPSEVYTNVPPTTIWTIRTDPYSGIETIYLGDWQPYRSNNDNEPNKESGKDDHYDSRVFLQYDIDVEIGDLVLKDSADGEYVQKILKYEDHIEVLTTRNKNSI